MTANNTRLLDALRARLAEIDSERDKVVALLAIYQGDDAHGPKTPSRIPEPARPTPPPTSSDDLFTARPQGPTARLLAVVEDTPGLRYGQVIDRAVVGMETEAGKPRRSLGSTLGSLVKRGRIRKEDSRYYPVQEE